MALYGRLVVAAVVIVAAESIRNSAKIGRTTHNGSFAMQHVFVDAARAKPAPSPFLICPSQHGGYLGVQQLSHKYSVFQRALLLQTGKEMRSGAGCLVCMRIRPNEEGQEVLLSLLVRSWLGGLAEENQERV